MNILPKVIGNMTKEEIRNFKLFLNRTEKATVRKDEQLFDFIRKQFPEYDESKILKRLYESDDKNALYRLKNRLFEDIGKSLTLHYYDATEYNIILNFLFLSRLFQNKGQTQTAFYYLTKAFRKANENEQLEWLDIIYGEFIRLSHETIEINPEEYILKRKENRSKLSKMQEIDDILAALIYRIKVSQNFAKENTEILQLLQRTINDFAKSKEVKNSPVLRFKIYQSVSRILLQQQDYKSLEKYLLKTFEEFSKEKLFNKNNHDTKLQMLTYLINSLFKNKKIDLSLEYVDLLKSAMLEFGKVLYDKYLFYYYNSLVINYSVKNTDKAIEILNEAKENSSIKKLPIYNVFVYLNLAVLNFDKKNFKEALKSLVKPMMQDAFKHLDEAWHLKLAVFELMIRFELLDFDYLEHKSERIKKEYSALLKKEEYSRQKQMVTAIDKMVKSDGIKKNKQLLKEINMLLEGELSNSSSDSDIINYSDWLKMKIN
jgi:tetratricopeptide (TPR) repeat protein